MDDTVAIAFITVRHRPLLYDSFLQVFGQVGTHDAGHMVGSYLLHVVGNHQPHQLLERGGLRIPAEFLFRFGGVAPEVDYVRGAVEVFGVCMM